MPEHNGASEFTNQPEVISASFTLNKAYYAACFAAWRSSAGRYGKYQLLLGAIATVAGTGLLTMTRSFSLSGAVLLVIGIAETIGYFWTRHQWISDRLRDSADKMDMPCSLRFSEPGVDHSGPTASGHIPWTDFRKISVSRLGLLLHGSPAVSLFVPIQSLTPAPATETIQQWHNISHGSAEQTTLHPKSPHS